MPATDAPATARVPRALWVALAAFGLLTLALLVTQIVLLRAQLDTVQDQRGIAARQAERAKPVIEGIRPLVGDARAAAPDIARLGRRAGRLMDVATPLAVELARADLGGTTRTVARDVNAMAAMVDALLALQREITTLQHDVAAMQRETLALQREAVGLQRESLAVQRTSLGIQRSTEAHAASVDRKTGGPAPPVPLGGR
jgi:hypothetical protein